MLISIHLYVLKIILQMCKCNTLLEVRVILSIMQTTLVNKCLATHIIVLHTNKQIDMASWLLVCYSFKGTPKEVINDH